MKPKDFKAWRSKLDKLKQVVRVANPTELSIHQSRFTMSKRRAMTQDKRPTQSEMTQIQSQAVNLEEDSFLSKSGAGDEDVPETPDMHESTQKLQEDDETLEGITSR